MSEVEQHDHDQAHTGPIKTPKQLIATVVAAFVVPIVVIILLTNFVSSGSKEAAGSDVMSAEATALRIQPVGRIEIKAPSDASTARTGEQVFQQVCSACHASGALGAPKFGDAAAWGPRIKQGFETLVQSAMKGKNAMPPQAGGDTSDFEIARAVVYMANQGGAKFDEPKPPAAAASEPASSATK